MANSLTMNLVSFLPFSFYKRILFKVVILNWYYRVLSIAILHSVSHIFVIKHHKVFNTFSLYGLQYEVLR